MELQPDLVFGTSGLRGPVSALNGPPAFTWTFAFLANLMGRGALRRGECVFLGRDLRASSPDIARYVIGAIEHAGLTAIDCGELPTPALAFHASRHGAPAIMVTGSHIPEDRNGLKFYKADGEINKGDEAAIVCRHDQGALGDQAVAKPCGQVVDLALRSYAARYIEFFDECLLRGIRVGVWQHSSVARDLLLEVLSALGADAVPLGRVERFFPVDTEALGPEDYALLKRWANDGRFDAIVSTDGDADRPLIADERGEFVRGDLVGAITASSLGADCIVTPVTSNSSLETCKRFSRVIRTRVGSPYVIEGIGQARNAGADLVVGFEANGGVLLGSQVERRGRVLLELPTRDCLLPIICCLGEVADKRTPLSGIAHSFGFRVVLSDRLKDVSRNRSAIFLTKLGQDWGFVQRVFSDFGGVSGVDVRDGVRISTSAGEIVHFRASGNAPELRCYVESMGQDRSEELLAWGLGLARAQLEVETSR